MSNQNFGGIGPDLDPNCIWHWNTFGFEEESGLPDSNVYMIFPVYLITVKTLTDQKVIWGGSRNGTLMYMKDVVCSQSSFLTAL